MTVALLAGATGLVGQELLRGLCDDPSYTEVHALVRRPLDTSAAKLRTHVVDFAAELALPKVDHVFIALGTTMKKAGSEAAFRAVDHDAVIAVAKAARAQGAEALFVVSSLGANAGSSVFYNRTKGQTEDALGKLGYPRSVMFRPSVLDGPRGESRPGEQVGVALGKALSFAMVGSARRYRPIHVATVARAMLRVAAQSGAGHSAVESDEIARLGA
jgi:uncharacterized protein YbjT (DUF2867 family)